ncbi:hypothetical protein NHP194022_08910 [Helicobacter suis]|nr:hypothetical protein NHP194022_08910 [Helicobacter suis]
MQELVGRIDKAYKKFFKKQGRPPRFKKVANYQSFTFSQCGYKIKTTLSLLMAIALSLSKPTTLQANPRP